MVEFLIERYGLESVRAILADLAEGRQINTTISKHAAPIKDIEQQFETFARKRAEDLAPEVDFEKPDKDQFDPADYVMLLEWFQEHPNNFWALTLYAKTLLAEL